MASDSAKVFRYTGSGDFTPSSFSFLESSCRRSIAFDCLITFTYKTPHAATKASPATKRENFTLLERRFWSMVIFSQTTARNDGFPIRRIQNDEIIYRFSPSPAKRGVIQIWEFGPV